MKIRWVEATNFRKFVGTVRVADIGNGLNMLVGENEMGKSTLMEAINGVVFERARAQTKETRSFRHFTNRTVPEVSIGFDLDGKIWSLRKRFAGPAGKAILQNSDGCQYEDEEAEAELQRLLGFKVSGRNAELGIWGMLWVRQGHSFGDPALDERARQTVRSCLEAQVGVITGGLRGQRIPRSVEYALEQIVSSKGPRGRYKVVCDQFAAANAGINELEAKRDRLLAGMARLVSLRRELRSLNEDWNKEENEHRIEIAYQKRTAAERKSEEIKTARSNAALARERAERARAESDIRASLIADIERRDASLRNFRQEFQLAEGMKGGASRLLAEREGALRNLGERERQMARVGRNLHRVHNVVLLTAELAHYEAVISQVQQTQEHAEPLAEQIGRMPATVNAIAAIESAMVEVSAASAALNATATLIGFRVEKDAIDCVTLDAKPITAATATYEVVEDILIGITGVGDIAIRPQIKNREAILERVDRSTRNLQAALEAADADSPTAARAAAARRRELEYQFDGLRRDIERLVPGDIKTNLAPGLEALKIRIEELRGRRDAETTGLAVDALRGRDIVESQIRENTVEAEKIASEIIAADAALDGLRRAAEEAREKLDGLRRKISAEEGEIEAKKATLAAGRSRTADDVVAGQRPRRWSALPQNSFQRLRHSNNVGGNRLRISRLKLNGLKTPHGSIERNPRDCV
jgi:DNA repair exonuclease SbcCD ATPase subunit